MVSSDFATSEADDSVFEEAKFRSASFQKAMDGPSDPNMSTEYQEANGDLGSNEVTSGSSSNQTHPGLPKPIISPISESKSEINSVQRAKVIRTLSFNIRKESWCRNQIFM